MSNLTSISVECIMWNLIMYDWVLCIAMTSSTSEHVVVYNAKQKQLGAVKKGAAK